jgi:hypothetical protein
MTAIWIFARNWWVKTEVSDGALPWWRLRHSAFAVLPSEPVGMSHNQFPPPQQCREWSDVHPNGRALEFVQQFQELCSFCVSLRVRRQLMCDRSWTGHAVETSVNNSPKACWIIVRVSVPFIPRLAQNLMRTCCSCLWSIVKIATGDVHDSKQTRVETAHVHPAMCNLAHWLTRHGSPTIYRCFALLQLLHRWRHQSGKFWIPPLIFLSITATCFGYVNAVIIRLYIIIKIKWYTYKLWTRSIYGLNWQREG